MADADRAEALAGRLVEATVGAMDLQMVYVGHRLGWYRDLASSGASTSAELASRTDTAERYAREWLEQQAVTGLLTVETESAEPGLRRFALPPAHAAVLVDELSPTYVLPLARIVAAGAQRMPQLLAAYRTGGGVSWDEQGADAREGQAAMNRPMLLHSLGRTYLPGIPDVDTALRAGGRVADLGCGFGWSSIGIALAYPWATVDGVDVDEPSVAAARDNAAQAGVSDRVRFRLADGADPTLDDAPYDLVIAVECVHDLADPVGFLATMRRLAGGTGVVVVVDERVAEEFTAPGELLDRLMYGFSMMLCLPDGLSQQPSAATGTVMRPAQLTAYARSAGFADVEVLDVEDPFFRFYRLVG